ncbi:hypothetical protein [Pseudomonas protegens]|uniref:hypothetical protein n=1 Tax=Pseudomonas protegens TaxID=380021 RepID=UPI0021892CE9|nr:MAG: hypothetical protein NAG77_11620 [Pseudomonas protegens]WEK23597.1 MAG: hypothetical protein P0Y61_25480 [Pseudomonas protegens]
MSNIDARESPNVYDVLLRIIGIVSMIVAIPFLLILVLFMVYLLAVAGVFGTGTGIDPQELKSTLLSVWKDLIPIATQAIQMLLPIITLILVAGALKWLLPSGSFSLEKLKDNLTAILAIVVISTVCMLPLLGAKIPLALSNIALVVVGYYFGKLKT